MRRRLFGLAVSFVMLLSFATAAFPCGDKFLVVGRGMRYGTAKHPTAILIYTHNTQQSKDLESILKMAGHKLLRVTDEAELRSSVNKGLYSLVLIDLSDAVFLEEQIQSMGNKPTVVPVIYTYNGTELTDAKAKYDCVLRGEKKNRNMVKVIDSVMEERANGVPPKCDWAKK